jgi:hypothetical protein
MKIIKNLFLVASLAFLASCGSKSEVKEACLCSKLNQGFDENAEKNGIYSYQAQPYTGICETLDQYDTLIEKKEFKNGFMINSYQRQKIGNIYVTIDSMTYDNGIGINGFQIVHSSIFDFDFVEYVTDMKNGVDQGGKIDISNTNSGISVSYYSNEGDINFHESMSRTTDELSSQLKAFLDKVHETNSHFTYY